MGDGEANMAANVGHAYGEVAITRGNIIIAVQERCLRELYASKGSGPALARELMAMIQKMGEGTDV